MRAAGADGCKVGWVCLAREAGGALDAYCVATAAELITLAPRPNALMIDVPIGLLDKGTRHCDEEARRLLGPRRSSVFSAPLRPVVAANSWAEACEVRGRIEDKRMSQQAWGIAPKVREVDELLRSDPALQSWVREVHPEVCFMAWSGRPMMHAKKNAAGREERQRLVDEYFGPTAVSKVRAGFARKHVADDDILDAFAALWSAERLLRGEARVIPARPPVDAFGLAMEMVF